MQICNKTSLQFERSKFLFGNYLVCDCMPLSLLPTVFCQCVQSHCFVYDSPLRVFVFLLSPSGKLRERHLSLAADALLSFITSFLSSFVCSFASSFFFLDFFLQFLLSFLPSFFSFLPPSFLLSFVPSILSSFLPSSLLSLLSFLPRSFVPSFLLHLFQFIIHCTVILVFLICIV